MVRENQITIAVIGTGLIGPRHATSVVACKDTTLLVLVDPALQAEAIASSFHVPLFKSVELMLQGGYRPDAAIVCTPNSTHVEVAKNLLAAGVHVLVEKPISTTIKDGSDLVQAARCSGKQLLVGHHRRFNPYITATKKALLDGVIGVPIALSGLWVLCKPRSYFAAPTEWRAKRDGGGVILINMIHEVDMLQYLFGPVIKVHAEPTSSQRGQEAEEGAAILLRFASGLVGTFLLCDASPSAHNFESSTGENPMIPQYSKDFCRVFGTEGTLSVGDMKLTRHASGEESSWTNTLEESLLSIGCEVPFDEQIKHLVRVVRGEEQSKCSGENGLSALTVCSSIKEALTEGSAIVVGE